MGIGVAAPVGGLSGFLLTSGLVFPFFRSDQRFSAML
jgi:hypothetical protein